MLPPLASRLRADGLTRSCMGMRLLSPTSTSLSCPSLLRRKNSGRRLPGLTTCRRSTAEDGLSDMSTGRAAPVPRGLATRQVPMRERRQYQGAGRSTVLPRSLVANKEVITRVSGRLLGVIAYFFVDPRTLTVVSMDLRPKGLGMAPRANLLLSTLCQIGDVALVHDETALDLPPLTEREGCMRLTGCDVQSHDGTVLGKVRDYSFSPDTGQIVAIKYDSLGQPVVPESIMTVWEVNVQYVQSVNPKFLVLQPGAQDRAVVISDGFIGQLYRGVQGLLNGSEGDWGAAIEDPSYEDWKQVHGLQFARYYGLQEVPATRREADIIVRGASRALPQPRQPALTDSIDFNTQNFEPARRTKEGVLAARNAAGPSVGGRAMPMYKSYMTEGQRPAGAMSREDANRTPYNPQREWGGSSRSRPTPDPRPPLEDVTQERDRTRRSYTPNNPNSLQNDRKPAAGYSSPVTSKVGRPEASIPGTMRTWDD